MNQNLEGTEKFLVDVLVKPGNKIFVFIDGDRDISINDCVSLSKHIEGAIDRDREDFELNVSSSGLDYPFKMPRQYKKHIGKKISVLTAEGTKTEGTLEEATEEGIKFRADVRGKKAKEGNDNESIFLNYNQIKEAKRVVSFKNS